MKRHLTEAILHAQIANLCLLGIAPPLVIA